MNTDKRPPDPPGPSDVWQTIAGAAVSAIPVAGGPAAELLDLLRLPVAKRQYEWLSDVAARLKQLEAEKRLSIEALGTAFSTLRSRSRWTSR